MSMLTFDSPLTVKRPYGSYRFDVFSLKAGRRMTLYGKAALSQFTELEADHEVISLCERPLRIPDSKPLRVIDFWAQRGGQSHFYLLLSAAGVRDMSKPKPAIVEFKKWIASEQAVLHEIVIDIFNDRRIYHDNWTLILQHLVAHRSLVTPSLLERLVMELEPVFTLEQVESQICEMDAMLVRAGVFGLLAAGRLSCPSIGEVHLAPSTQFIRR